MYHSTSGKNGFRPYEVRTDYQIEKSLLIQILKREDELRHSQEYQNEYTKSDDLGWLRDVTTKIQERALAEYGITDSQGLIVLRNARFQYKDDPSINQLTVYMRQDRSRLGDLKYHDLAPDANLFTLENNQITFLQYLDSLPKRPNVIFVGSIS